VDRGEAEFFDEFADDAVGLAVVAGDEDRESVVTGLLMAAPTPWTRRAATRVPEFWATRQATEESANRAVPPTRMRRRPSRSAARPPNSRNPP
jgi:hypothetical protein